MGKKRLAYTKLMEFPVALNLAHTKQRQKKGLCFLLTAAIAMEGSRWGLCHNVRYDAALNAGDCLCARVRVLFWSKCNQSQFDCVRHVVTLLYRQGRLCLDLLEFVWVQHVCYGQAECGREGRPGEQWHVSLSLSLSLSVCAAQTTMSCILQIWSVVSAVWLLGDAFQR